MNSPKLRSLLLLASLGAVLSTPSRAALVISEFLATNDAGTVDSFGATSDWIELQNTGTEAISLTGWKLTDELGNADKWSLPEQELLPGAYLLVWCSGRSGGFPTGGGGTEWHANFALTGTGGYVALTSPTGDTAQAISYRRQFWDVSTVLLPGGLQAYAPTPTPGAANTTTVLTDYVRDTKFSADRGYYRAAFPVEITCSTPEAIIRYTTDGSEPTATTGSIYTAPLTIVKATVLRVRAFKDGLVPTNTDTQTYIFPADWIAQPPAPAGFPVAWGNPRHFARPGLDPGSLVRAAYAMDTRVTSATGAVDELRSVFSGAPESLPVVCVTSAVANLFGTDGVYANGRIESKEWPVAVEYFDPRSPGQQFQTRAAVTAHGAGVKHFAKKALRLDFTGPKADGPIRFPLFPGAATESFDKLVLRTGGHDSFTVTTRGTVSDAYDLATHASYLRDHFLRQTEAEAGLLTPRSRYVHLCLNGLYWGVYDLLEKPSAAWCQLRQGGEEAEWDVLHHPNIERPATTGPRVVLDGSGAGWDSLMAEATAAATPTQFAAVLEKLGGVRFVDHLLIRMWAGDQDWLGPATLPRNTGTEGPSGNAAFYTSKNWYAVSRRGVQPWQFFAWDAEICMGSHLLANFLGSTAGMPSGLNWPVNQRQLHFDYTGISSEDTPARFWSLLSVDAAFKKLVGERAVRLFGSGGLLSPPKAVSRLQQIVAQLHKPMLAESARWGAYSGWGIQFVGGTIYFSFNLPGTTLFTRQGHWVPETTWLQDSFATQRAGIMLAQLRARGLFPLVDPPIISPPGGVASHFQATAASHDEIWYTLDGSDPESSLATATLLPSGGTVPLPNSRTTLRARSRLGNEWSGMVELVFNPARQPRAGDLAITELYYHPAPLSTEERSAGLVSREEAEFLELTNLTGEPLDLSELTFAAGIDFTFAADSRLQELPPKAVVVIAATPHGFLTRHGSGVEPIGYFANGTALANSGERLKIIDSAGNVLLEFNYGDSNDAWEASPDGSGTSLELLGPAFSPPLEEASSWGASAAQGGTPGRLPSMDYAYWQASAMVGAEEGQTSPQADPDGDGLVNLVEYLQRTDPLIPDAYQPTVSVKAAGLTAGEPGSVSFRFPSRPDATDYRLALDLSPNLQDWRTQSTEPANGSTWWQEAVRSGPETVERRFARLRVVRK